MPTAEVHEYRNTARALAVVARAREVMSPAELAVALDVAESTIRMWKVRPDTAIDVGTARRLRRLDRRLAR